MLRAARPDEDAEVRHDVGEAIDIGAPPSERP